MAYLTEFKNRHFNAINDFNELLVSLAGISQNDAARVTAFYLKNKIAKVDNQVSRVQVQHGAFLDKETILRAVEMAA